LNRRLGQDVSSKPRPITTNHHIGQLGWLKLTVPFVPTKEVLNALRTFHPEDWGAGNARGKELSAQGLSRMIRQVAKVHTTRVEHNGARGYLHADLVPSWGRLGIAPYETDTSGLTGPTDTAVSDMSVVSGVSVPMEGMPVSVEPDKPVDPVAMDGMCALHPDIRLHNGKCGRCIAEKYNKPR